MRLVEYSQQAAKTLAKMDRRTSNRILAKIDQLASDPASLANNVIRMKGDSDLFRLRVGDWRIICRDGIILLIVRIAPRGSAYE
jgi:mRNA interferase RelE/StbE